MILDKSISLPSYIMFQEFDDESILLDIRTQEHFGLDPISSTFLKGIQSGLSGVDASSLVLQEYDVTKEQLTIDLNTLLDSLVKNELIEVS